MSSSSGGMSRRAKKAMWGRRRSPCSTSTFCTTRFGSVEWFRKRATPPFSLASIACVVLPADGMAKAFLEYEHSAQTAKQPKTFKTSLVLPRGGRDEPIRCRLRRRCRCGRQPYPRPVQPGPCAACPSQRGTRRRAGCLCENAKHTLNFCSG